MTALHPAGRLLEQAGCYSLGLGIESGFQRIVDHMKRGQKLEMIEEKIRLIRRVSRIRLSGFFIVGYPEESEQDIVESIKLDHLQFSKVALQQINYVPARLTFNQLKRLLRKAYIEFYALPKIILGLLREIRSAEHLRNILKRVIQAFFIK